MILPLATYLSCALLVGQTPNSVQLLIPNAIQKAEHSATDNRAIEGQWIGIYRKDGQWNVQDVKIAGSKFSPNLRFAFVVRGILSLNEKSKLIYSADIDPKNGLGGLFKHAPFKVEFSGPTNGWSEPRASLVIRFSGREQRIQCRKGEDFCRLIWCGDIDFDGQPDFLIYTRDDNGNSVHSLFLSSLAKPGEIAALAADYVYLSDG